MSVANEAFIQDNSEDSKDSSSKEVNQLVDSSEFIMDNLKIETQEESLDKDPINTNPVNGLALALIKFRNTYNEGIFKHEKIIKRFSTTLLVISITLYVGAVIHQFYLTRDADIDWCQGYGMAFILFSLTAWTAVYYTLVVPYLVPQLIMFSNNKMYMRAWRKGQLVIVILLLVLLSMFLIWDTASDHKRLISVGGLLTFIAGGFIFSKNPSQVKWKTVFSGLAIQFALGLLAIRWSTGRQAFKCVGNLAEKFLEYSYVGATLVFGERIVREDAVFAFQALSAIFFVSMIVQVLFYLGWMQIMCLKLGWIIQVTMGTTVMESVNAVSSVFLGMTEAPLLYKPYIKDLTPSELHAVMAGGFSTIAGTVFAAYAAFGVNPAHIITASIMTAPAALCYAKLVYPEDSLSKTDCKNIQIYRR